MVDQVVPVLDAGGFVIGLGAPIGEVMSHHAPAGGGQPGGAVGALVGGFGGRAGAAGGDGEGQGGEGDA